MFRSSDEKIQTMSLKMMEGAKTTGFCAVVMAAKTGLLPSSPQPLIEAGSVWNMFRKSEGADEKDLLCQRPSLRQGMTAERC